MKNITVIFSLIFLIFTGAVYGSVRNAIKYYKEGSIQHEKKIILELYQSRYYFSTLPFLKNHLHRVKKIDKDITPIIRNLMIKTGFDSFLDVPDEVLKKFNYPSLKFLRSLKHFKKRNYEESIRVLQNFPVKHKFFPEAMIIKGPSYQLINNHKEALKVYTHCAKESRSRAGSIEKLKLKRYYKIIEETCLIHKARVHFQNQKYKQAITELDKIEKTSYKWPFILLEKAWANYYLQNYNRALGLLVTYKSPLLSSYFLPESEVLTALSYFRLCLYDDSSLNIDEYYRVYKKRSGELKKILTKNLSSHTYFYKLALASLSKTEKMAPYMRNLMNQARKKVKFSLNLVALKRAKKELKVLKKFKNSGQLIEDLKKEVSSSIFKKKRTINFMVKREIYGFINEIHRLSYEMFNINLEIMSRKRDMVYKNQKLISNRGRGSLKNMNRTVNQLFFDFKGAFWADELGDYSFGLKSNCKKVEDKNLAMEGNNE